MGEMVIIILKIVTTKHWLWLIPKYLLFSFFRSENVLVLLITFV